MLTDRLPKKRLSTLSLTAGLVLALTFMLAPRASADTAKNVGIPRPPAVFGKAVPENVEDLKAMQEHVRKVVERVLPCTVGLRVGPGQGSGVIVSEDGYILTAGHVSGKPGQDVTIILPDGKQLKGKSLGRNGLPNAIGSMDSGLVKITDDGKFPFLEMGKSGDLKKGQWCIAVGHPGGWKQGRSPVVRVGRILDKGPAAIRTDCTLVGGDSGGPLFDMEGRVIGINSRIGGPITANIHVPVDTYRETWDRLVSSEEWGAGLGGNGKGSPYLGVQGDTENNRCKITSVTPNSPADKAGLRADDIVTKFNNNGIQDYDRLADLIRASKPGDRVILEVVRGGETMNLNVTIGRRSAN
jgi:serine protease Do